MFNCTEMSGPSYDLLESNILVPSLVLMVYVYVVLAYTYLRDKHMRNAERVILAFPLAVLLVWYKRHIRAFFTADTNLFDFFVMYFAIWGIYQWIFALIAMFMILFLRDFFVPVFFMHTRLPLVLFFVLHICLLGEPYGGVIKDVFMTYIF